MVSVLVVFDDVGYVIMLPWNVYEQRKLDECWNNNFESTITIQKITVNLSQLWNYKISFRRLEPGDIFAQLWNVFGKCIILSSIFNFYNTEFLELSKIYLKLPYIIFLIHR